MSAAPRKSTGRFDPPEKRQDSTKPKPAPKGPRSEDPRETGDISKELLISKTSSTVKTGTYHYSSPPLNNYELKSTQGRRYTLLTESEQRDPVKPQLASQNPRKSDNSLIDPPVNSNTQPYGSQLPENNELKHSHGGRHTASVEAEQSSPGLAVEVLIRPFTLVRQFAQIAPGDFPACQYFISDNGEILREDSNLVLQEALEVYCSGQQTLARSYMQVAYLITKCSPLSRVGRREYFDDLRAQKKSALQAFWTALRKIEERIIDQAQTQTQRVLLQPNAQTYGAPRQAVSSWPLSRMEDASKTDRYTPGPPSLVNAMVRMNLSSTKYHNTPNQAKLALTYNSGGGQTTGLPTSIPENSFSPSNRHNLPSNPLEQFLTESRPRASSDARHSTTWTGDGGQSVEQAQITIKGTDGDEEKLDPRYKKRTDPITFFAVGRVFAILFHENAGRSKKPKEDFGQAPRFSTQTKGKYGEWIFSHIRRMVVVRQRHGYCWCIPINTYGGRGVGKNISANEAESHTIIFGLTGTPPTPQPLRTGQKPSTQSQPVQRKPQPLSTEQIMTKIPIAVVMAENHVLDSMSRLNFAKVFTVEHNVKVMEIGRVDPISMPWLEGYWRNEAAGPSSRPL